MQLVPVTFGGPRSCNGLLSFFAIASLVMACNRTIGTPLARMPGPASWACSRSASSLTIQMWATTVFKFASGGLLVDALFRFGLHMREPENVVRDAYLEAMEGEITCVNIDGASSQLAAAGLDLLLRQQTTAAAWRESGCALVLWASERASE